MAQHSSPKKRRSALLGVLLVSALVPLLIVAVLTVSGRWPLIGRGQAPAVETIASGAHDAVGAGRVRTPLPSLASSAAGPSSTRPVSPSRTVQSSRSSTRPPSSTTATPSGLSAQAAEVLRLTNQNRAEHGCTALRVDSRLVTAAQGHANDMVTRHYFDHVSPDGTSATDRAKAAGYPGGVGENIAVGYPSAAAVMTGWMASTGHRANILNCSYTVIGIGYNAGTVQARWGPGAWVQVFGAL